MLFTVSVLHANYLHTMLDFSLPLQENLSVLSSTLENGTDRLSRNVGKELPLLAA